LAIACWLAVWQVVAWRVGSDFLLASPVHVIVRASELVVTAPFWATVGTSFLRIGLGLASAAGVGVVTASLAARWRAADHLIAPLISTIRSAPVVSFIILLLLWTDAGMLAAYVSFLMVLPVMHTSTLEGLRHRDRHLAEFAEVFEVSWTRRLRAIDAPAVLPFFTAACRIGVGLAWKSGVAAEVIGVARGSIGEQLYLSKIFLESADLFAWTAVIVALSMACEALLLWSLRRAPRTLAGDFA
jgi:NitT/TauT family transport system permease protein